MGPSRACHAAGSLRGAGVMKRTERAAPPAGRCTKHRLDFQKSMTYMFIYARRGKVPTCHWFTGRDGAER